MFRKTRDRQEFPEDGAYAKYEREEVNRRRLFEGREGEPPKIYKIPQSWMMSTILLLYIYAGAVSITYAQILRCFVF
jgi:hypothetical protein